MPRVCACNVSPLIVTVTGVPISSPARSGRVGNGNGRRGFSGAARVATGGLTSKRSPTLSRRHRVKCRPHRMQPASDNAGPPRQCTTSAHGSQRPRRSRRCVTAAPETQRAVCEHALMRIQVRLECRTQHPVLHAVPRTASAPCRVQHASTLPRLASLPPYARLRAPVFRQAHTGMFVPCTSTLYAQRSRYVWSSYRTQHTSPSCQAARLALGWACGLLPDKARRCFSATSTTCTISMASSVV